MPIDNHMYVLSGISALDVNCGMHVSHRFCINEIQKSKLFVDKRNKCFIDQAVN